MRQRYRVNHCPAHKVKLTHMQPTKIVQYFISAEEIEWDYSPDRDWEREKHNGTLEDRCVCLEDNCRMMYLDVLEIESVISGITNYCLLM